MNHPPQKGTQRTRFQSDLHLRQLQQRHAELSRSVAALSGRANADYPSWVLSCIDGNAGHARAAEAVCASSREIENATGYTARGVWVPMARGLSVGSATAGGHTTEQPLDGGLIEALAPHSAVIASGATVVTGMTGSSFGIPKFGAGASVGWVAENGNAPTADPTFAQVVVQPRTVAATVTITRQLIRSSRIRDIVEYALAVELNRALMQEIDRVALAGTGAGSEPLGILNHGDVPVVSAGDNGAAPTWGLLCDLEDSVTSAGATGAAAWVTNSRVRKKLRRTVRVTDGDAVVWPGADLLGYPARVSEHVPSDLTKGTSEDVCSAIVHGIFQHLFIGIWGPSAYDLIVDPHAYGPSGKVRLVALMDVGIGLRHPGAFSVCKDVLTS
jgi:HK97 family phage major capsid protein